ncbi:nucleoside-diphosphate sugar epimerase [Rhodoferax sp. TS-BS-61-7]|nr:nucleoside-diphosphate sugar epimerase [Rhodoferax sp. TS-BS-61-7]
MAARVALVAGATGLVGREVLAALLADKQYSAVHSLGRRTLPLTHPKLTQHIVDFAALPELPRTDDVFICLGTTIKVAGSQQAFRAVDYEAVMAVALAGYAQGATKLGVVSAMGSDPKSSIFYNRTKGAMEAAVSSIGYQSVSIAQPSMLAGNRASLDQPVRKGEILALNVSRWLGPLIPANYRPILAADVAAGLVRAVRNGRPGVQRILSGELQGANQHP